MERPGTKGAPQISLFQYLAIIQRVIGDAIIQLTFYILIVKIREVFLKYEVNSVQHFSMRLKGLINKVCLK